MLKQAADRALGFAGRFTEITGVLLALFAGYEMIVADRVVPTLVGGVALCEIEDRPDYISADVFFRFIADHADGVVYLDMFLTPVGREGSEISCKDGQPSPASDSDYGFTASGPARVYSDQSTGATPDILIRSEGFQIPQTARLTGQSGEEPIFGVTGLVYIEAHELDMGFQTFELSAAPYDASMLKMRDCAQEMTLADGPLDRASTYIFTCMAQ